MKRIQKGFTLAEVLIALALLGVVAAFTIPKVMENLRNRHYNAMAKEAMGMVSNAYEQYKLKNNYGSSPPTTTVGEDLVPYMNYVSRETSGQMDRTPNQPSSIDCSLADFVCLRLHNGAVLSMSSKTMMTSFSFGGNGKLNAINFNLDPNGKYDGVLTDNPGSGLGIWLYYDGQLRTGGNVQPNSVRADGITYSPGSPAFMVDPTWFKWQP